MVTPVKRHINKTVIELNIKVATGKGILGQGDAQTSQTQAKKPIRINIPAVDHDIDPDLLIDNIEYIKAYQHCQQLYAKEQFEDLRANMRKIMEKAKIPMSEPNFRMMGQFDDVGHLLTSDWTKVDPVKVAEADEDEEDYEDADDDVDADDDGDEEESDDRTKPTELLSG
ncbi:hypothetical protein KSP39_PZI010303 [Platanthera zijinensis]|uniref:Uncharacterized protein n=1 Tax=Platanthera zijinensis TaxID=2320716 RepID=A0AAP0G6Y6_9ASPA